MNESIKLAVQNPNYVSEKDGVYTSQAFLQQIKSPIGTTLKSTFLKESLNGNAAIGKKVEEEEAIKKNDNTPTQEENSVI